MENLSKLQFKHPIQSHEMLLKNTESHSACAETDFAPNIPLPSAADYQLKPVVELGFTSTATGSDPPESNQLLLFLLREKESWLYVAQSA